MSCAFSGRGYHGWRTLARATDLEMLHICLAYHTLVSYRIRLFKTIDWKPTVSVRSPTVKDSELSARTKIREAALTLFGTAGFGVSVRAIADVAGCSPGLVIHHFGTKQGLREAVDESILETLLQKFAGIPSHLPADELSSSMGTVFADVIGTSPEIRQYLRRSLLEGTQASEAIFDELLALTNRSLDLLEQVGGLRASSDVLWRPFQVLFVILGTLLLEPVIQRHIDEPVYAPEVLRKRTAANYDLLARGLFLPTARSEPEEESS
jgi:TetR/AcrR family transcriptional regulator, regulator of cefoperazone and chloramphenicol sensitivity